VASKVGRPFLRRGRWWVDLGSGPRELSGVPASPDAEDLAYRAALSLAVAVRPLAAGNQLDLVAPSQVVTLRGAAEGWRLGSQDAHTEGGRTWRAQYTAAVVRELGGERLSSFEPPGGNVRVVEYHRRLVAKGLGPKTIKNRLSILGRILRHAAEHAELSGLPVMPVIRGAGEAAEFPVIQESDLRAVRALVLRWVTDPRRAWQRATWLSVAFYCGLHAADVARFSLGDLVSWPPVGWIRRNTKSSRFVPPAQMPIAPQLAVDLVDAARVLGMRPSGGWTGGPWRGYARLLGRVARELGTPIPTGRVLRRSCVWGLAASGWSERECAEFLGHVDQRMIRSVYLRFPVGQKPAVRTMFGQLAGTNTGSVRLLSGCS
jgi:integrase